MEVLSIHLDYTFCCWFYSFGSPIFEIGTDANAFPVDETIYDFSIKGENWARDAGHYSCHYKNVPFLGKFLVANSFPSLALLNETMNEKRIILGYFSIFHIHVFWCKCSYIWSTLSLCRQLRSRSFWRFFRPKYKFIIFGFKLWKQWDHFMPKLWSVNKRTWLVPNRPIVWFFWPHFHVSFNSTIIYRPTRTFKCNPFSLKCAFILI